jgi:6-phosphofructokinase 1
MEYTRDLGYCAAKYLLEGGNAALVSMQAGHFVPIPFESLWDSEMARTRVRLVDIRSARYAIARRYMLRLRRDDFADERELAKLAAAANLSVAQFREQFQYLVADEPPPLVLQRDTVGGARD